jgi:acyl carrier protein
VVADVLGVPVTSLTRESSPDTVLQWDSLSHLNLVLALESEFGVTLTDDDVMEMLSVSLIEAILTERGANAGA